MMNALVSKTAKIAACLCGGALLFSGAAQADESRIRNRTISYVMTDLFWSVYQTEDAKQECPRGFNDGPREQFEKLFPYHEGLSVEETQSHRVLWWGARFRFPGPTASLQQTALHDKGTAFRTAREDHR